MALTLSTPIGTHVTRDADGAHGAILTFDPAASRVLVTMDATPGNPEDVVGGPLTAFTAVRARRVGYVDTIAEAPRWASTADHYDPDAYSAARALAAALADPGVDYPVEVHGGPGSVYVTIPYPSGNDRLVIYVESTSDGITYDGSLYEDGAGTDPDVEVPEGVHDMTPMLTWLAPTGSHRVAVDAARLSLAAPEVIEAARAHLTTASGMDASVIDRLDLDRLVALLTHTTGAPVREFIRDHTA